VPVLKAEVARAEVLDYLRPGDLVMADVSEDFKGVGACVELVNLKRRKVTAGLHTFVLRDIDGKTAEGFRGYLFKEYGLAKELRRIATGVSVYGLSKTNLSKVLLALPPLDEQKAIVEVLSAADREIDALRRKLAVWKAQKKYLLNNLVDGSIRLPEFASAAKEVAG
jgi:type I restriction enzyme S subunit